VRAVLYIAQGLIVLLGLSGIAIVLLDAAQTLRHKHQGPPR
jgi:hypothetical protein